ncbi:hypothetical protein BDN72DRAFT_902130 [Pluteus cervinus]|uniref:Uncharacterized protein n=1 Tax=Pluteus cervinus TaxID=181527 RepID=A0ACD3AEH6_9AGAR|nr:hypothetical protein BDN72DRAFT_902130 [Pluteus cervinus]
MNALSRSWLKQEGRGNPGRLWDRLACGESDPAKTGCCYNRVAGLDNTTLQASFRQQVTNPTLKDLTFKQATSNSTKPVERDSIPHGLTDKDCTHSLQAKAVMPSSSSIGVDELPDEILVEIFLLIPRHRWRTTPNHSTPHEHLHYPRPTYRKRLPWVLTHVCRKWREIARSTGRLWSYLPSINVCQPNPHLREYLSLAGTATPLSLHIRKETSKTDSEALSLVLERVEQWQDVMIVFPYDELPDLRPLRSSFQMLRAIHLIHHFGRDFPRDLFSDAPVLEELTYMIFAPNPILPPSLKKYHAYSPGPIDIIDLFSRAPQLVTVSLSNSSSSPWTHNQTELPPVVMPSLESLRLEDCWDDPGGPFLRALTLPRLQNLHLEMTADSDNLRYPHIIQMIQRSHASLRTLTIEAHIDAYPTPTRLRDLFAATPDLEFFRWCSRRAQRVENDLLAIFCDPGILPKLKTLIFDSWMYPAFQIDQSLLLNIIGARGPCRGYDTTSQGPNRWLTYLCVRKSDLNEDARVSLTGWSPQNDPHYGHLVDIKEHLKMLFETPVHNRQIEDIDTINHHLKYLTEEGQSFKLHYRGRIEVHILLAQLVLRGPSHPPGAYRIESDWIPKIEPALEIWKSRTREYVQASRWFRFHQCMYWVAENQSDVYDMFWETEPSPDSWFHFRRRSMPMTFLYPTKPYNWMPDWEHAELSYKAYQPLPLIKETESDDADLRTAK